MALIDNLSSYYKLDETTGTNADDAEGTDDGTANNARVFTTEVAGIINTGSDFTGGNDKIAINAHANLVNQTTYSLSFWVKGDASGDNAVFGFSQNNADAQSWWFTRESTDKLRIFIRNNSNAIRLVVTGSTVVFGDSSWHHVVFTDNNGTYVWYVDNSVESSGSYTKDTLTLDRCGLGFIDRGIDINGNCFIDELGLWDGKVLTSGEVSELWNDGNGFAHPFLEVSFTGIIVTEAEINFMAGENVNSTGNSITNKNALTSQIEAYLSNLVKFNIVTNWNSLDSTLKVLFTEYAARYCAKQIISFNPSGFTSRIEAEDMINIHLYRMKLIEDILNKSSVQDFLVV